MADPPAFSHPDRIGSSLYWFDSADNGGVHINSGINNKAAYLLTDGGTFNGQTVSALGMTKVATIYYEVQRNLLTSGSDYNDLYNLLYQACQNVIGTAGITAADCTEVREATLAVEMHLEPSAGFHPEAPVCTTGVPSNVFFDNLESGAGNWGFTVAVGGGTRWQLDSPFWGVFAHSGLHSLYADDFPAVVTDARATMNNAVAIPAGAFLHFHHAYELESDWDGGVVEYSTDNGATWTDAGSLFDHNGYTTTLTGSPNPLAGRATFSGSSHGYRSARLNLSSLAGQNVRFRWRMGLDTSIENMGWFVDEVRIYTCGSAATPSATISQLWPVTGAHPGGTSRLWAYVTNNGSVTLPADARVSFSVTGPSFNSTVGSATVAGLAPGASAWYFYDWAIPAGAQSGSYEYRAQVITDSQSISSLAGPQAFTVAGSTPAANVSQLWPVTGAQIGSTSSLWALVTNTGSVALPADARVWYYVTGPSFTVWVGSISVAGLAPGASAWYLYNWTIPGGAQAGTYGYQAQVWTSQAISSLFSPPQAFQVTTGMPANISQLWPVPGAARNATVPLWALVSNQSTTPLPADARVWFYVAGPSYTAWVGSVSVAGLAPGASVWYAYNWAIPPSQPLGSHQYHAQVWTTAAISPFVGPQAFSIQSFQMQRNTSAAAPPGASGTR
jgi:hypothetical protein